MSSSILGVGSPLLDVLARVDDTFLSEHIPGSKGGMEMVDSAFQQKVLASLEGNLSKAPGGSAGNTIFALAKLGSKCAMLGKLGDDSNGEFYKKYFSSLGGNVDEFVVTNQAPTGVCLSLITPDAERTMRSDLGASLLFSEEEVYKVDFSKYDIVYIEGYMLFSSAFDAIIECASKANCRIGIDLASFEVVGIFREKLLKLLPEKISIVLANAEEATALLGDISPEEQLAKLATMCDIAAVKLGKDGALVKSGNQEYKVPACLVEKPIDTTAAGDLWAAGFLYGLINNQPLDKAAYYGALISGEVVKVIGSVLPESSWEYIQSKLK